MAELVEVKAARKHRSGYAGGRVAKGGTYRVPEAAVAGLLKQKLITRRAAVVEAADVADGQD